MNDMGQGFGFARRWTAAVFCLSLLAYTPIAKTVADQPHDLATLLELQVQIESVVAAAMPACVSIGDGTGFGSGAVIDADGTILTAGHVISAGVTQFEIFFPDGRKTSAKLVGYNNDLDAGILRIDEPGPWPTVPVARAINLDRGDWTICLGHSGGYELGRKPPVRTGRVLEYRSHLVVTDAVLIGGDSGGPLFNLAGELIAIHSSIGDSVAENRHVTIDTFHREWQNLMRGGDWKPVRQTNAAKPAFDDQRLLPIVQGNQTPEPTVPVVGSAAGKLGLHVTDTNQGVQVQRILPGSAAERVGIRMGDIVLRFDGAKIESSERLMTLIDSKKVGQSASIDIVRQGRTLNLQVILDRL